MTASSSRPKEFLLLEYLVRNVNRPVTQTMILEHVWKSSFEGLTNVVDVYISALRSKLDRDFPRKLIHTKRGIGYTLTSVDTPLQELNTHGKLVIRGNDSPRRTDAARVVPTVPRIAEERRRDGSRSSLSNVREGMVRAERFELPTFWFVARRSIQLSYARMRTFQDYQTG